MVVIFFNLTEHWQKITSTILNITMTTAILLIFQLDGDDFFKSEYESNAMGANCINVLQVQNYIDVLQATSIELY